MTCRGLGVEAARKFAEEVDDGPRENEEYRERGGKGRGKVEFLEGDFYKRDWEEKTKNGFDVIYDYTVRAQFYLSKSPCSADPHLHSSSLLCRQVSDRHGHNA